MGHYIDRFITTYLNFDCTVSMEVIIGISVAAGLLFMGLSLIIGIITVGRIFVQQRRAHHKE